MKPMRIWQCAPWAFAAALAGTSLSGCTATSQSRPAAIAPPLAAMKQRLSADCAAGSFSGVVAVERRGKRLFLHACGWADGDRRRTLDPSARFRLFSISKTFTAAAILRLAERGRMNLDTPLSAYVKQVPAAWAGVTIRHLLQHQSGIADHTGKLLEAYRSGGHRSHAEAMRQVLTSLRGAEAALPTAPGQAWRYSNFGYELLAHAAATVEGRPFHEVMREKVFEPAAMPSSALELPHPDTEELRTLSLPDLATGFNGTAAEPKPVTQIYSFVQQGAGAVVAGYKDLFAFTRALRKGRLLRPETLARNERESIPVNDSVRYGFGWMIRKAGNCTYWQHSGGTNGYTSELAYVPDADLTIVVLSNLGFAEVAGYRRGLVEALLPGEHSPGKGTCHAVP
jgi:D-alanyl-D-alanine carboxypeptidase